MPHGQFFFLYFQVSNIKINIIDVSVLVSSKLVSETWEEILSNFFIIIEEKWTDTILKKAYQKLNPPQIYTSNIIVTKSIPKIDRKCSNFSVFNKSFFFGQNWIAWDFFCPNFHHTLYKEFWRSVCCYWKSVEESRSLSKWNTIPVHFARFQLSFHGIQAFCVWMYFRIRMCVLFLLNFGVVNYLLSDVGLFFFFSKQIFKMKTHEFITHVCFPHKMPSNIFYYTLRGALSLYLPIRIRVLDNYFRSFVFLYCVAMQIRINKLMLFCALMFSKLVNRFSFKIQTTEKQSIVKFIEMLVCICWKDV